MMEQHPTTAMAPQLMPYQQSPIQQQPQQIAPPQYSPGYASSPVAVAVANPSPMLLTPLVPSPYSSSSKPSPIDTKDFWDEDYELNEYESYAARIFCCCSCCCRYCFVPGTIDHCLCCLPVNIGYLFIGVFKSPEDWCCHCITAGWHIPCNAILGPTYCCFHFYNNQQSKHRYNRTIITSRPAEQGDFPDLDINRCQEWQWICCLTIQIVASN